MKLLISTATLLVLSLGATVSAQPLFHPTVNLSGTPDGVSSLTHAAAAGAQLIVVWREVRADGIEEIRLKRSTNHGAAFANVQTLAVLPESSRVFSLRAAISGTNVLVLYAAGLSEEEGELTLLRSTDSGASFTAATLAGPGIRGGDVALNVLNEVHVVFADGDGEVFYQRSADGGGVFSAPFNLSNSEAPSASPRLSVYDQRVAVVWQDDHDVALAYSPDGGASFLPVANASASPLASTLPVVAMLDAIHILWNENGVVVHRHSLDGATFSPLSVLSTPLPGEVVSSISMSGVTNLVNAAWSTRDASAIARGPFFRRSSDGGASFGPAHDLTSGAEGAHDASIASGIPVKLAWADGMSSDVLFLREIACSASWLAPVSDVWTNAARWSGGVVPGSTDDVCLTVSGSYTVTVRADQSANSVVVGAAGVTGPVLKIEGQRPGSSAPIAGTLTVGNGLTNFGRVTLTSIGTIPSGEARLTVSSGTLTNASGATIETLGGSQGGRTINATAVNDGTISFGWDSTLNGDWTNNNSVTLASGRTLTLGGTAAFSQNNGSLTLTGTLVSTGGTFNYNGGVITGTPLVLTSAALNIGPASTGGGAFKLRRDSTVSGNIASAQTLQIEAERPGSSAAIHATLTAAGDFINAGTIQLTAFGTSPSGTATLVVPTGSVLTNASTGRIEALSGSQGGRVLSGRFSNNGTVQVSSAMTISGTNALFTNNNSFIIDSTLSMVGSDDRFEQGAGTLDVNGTFSMVGGTFDFNGGTVDTTTGSAGAVILESAVLNFGPGSTGAAHFRMRRTSTLSGNIAAGQIVTIEGERPGSSAQIHATVTGIGNVTNAGTIQLTSFGTMDSGTATLTMAAGAVLTSAPTGRIETIQGSQGGRVINGHVVNNGTVVIGWSTVLGGTAATHTNNGLFQIQASRTLTISGDETFVQGGGTLEVDGTFHMTGATFNFNGGSVDASAGLAILESSALNFGPGSTGGAHFRVRRNSTLTGNIAAGQTVTIEGERPGSSAQIHATVTGVGNVTNAGTIQLTSFGTSPSGTATLAMGTGAMLTNASSGRIETLQGSQGGRALSGSVRNEGILAVATNSPLTYSAGTFRNVSPGTITGGGNLTLASTSTFFGTGSVSANISNSGQFNAGQSPGALSITGNFTQTTSGSLNVEIGGFTAGTEYDQIAISGSATLAGTLNVSLFGGFCEAGTFEVLTYTGGSGDFGTKNGLSQGGLIFTATRNSTLYRLNATGECVTAPIANNDAYSVDEDGVLNVAAPGVLANDTDPQHTALTAILFTSPSHGDVLLDPNGSLTYTPNADFFGTDSFAYVANDGSENSAPATVTITVNAVNDPPNAADDTATVDEDSGQNSVSVLANDESAPDAGETLTITAVTQGSSGAVVITGGGSGLTYAPNTNFSGTDTFTYTVSDGVFTDVATVNIQVNEINDPPDAIDDAATVDEDSGANAIDVLANDTTGGEAGETLSIEAVTQGANGVVAIGGGGTSVTYTPNPNFHGSDSFTYTTADGSGGTDTALVHVTVESVNDPPDAQDDAVSADEDSGVNQIDVLTNDTAAPDGEETLQVTAVTHGANGSVAISGGGTSVIYTPEAEFSGSDSFTYTISDGNGGVDTATVFVTVNSVNDPPDAADDTASVQEDSAANVIDVLANDTFAPDTGETLVITAVTQGTNGTVAIDEGWIAYTPQANFAGEDSFTYTISDGNGGADSATVIVTVHGVNDPPDANDDSASVDEDSGATSVDVLANDTLAPDAGETLAITAVTQGANGSVAITGGGTAVTYTPNADFAGSDSFTYTISDGNGGVDTATVIVTVTGVNDAPSADDASATTDEDQPVEITLSAADVDSAALTFSVVNGPSHGTVVLSGATVTYTPAPNYFGADSFTFRTSDGPLDSNTATVTLSIAAVNDAPTLSGVHDVTVLAGSLASFMVSGSDVEDASVTLEASGLVAGAQFDPASGEFLWTPATPGVFTFTFTARDSGGLFATTAAIITVTGSTNQPPSCAAARPSVESLWPPNGRSVPIEILGITDPDDGGVTIRISAITVNEPGASQDFAGIGGSSATVRAKRTGSNKAGRTYVIVFDAIDPGGASCSGQVVVTVPHDQGKSK